MNMIDLKSGEPFFGRWLVKDYIGSTSSGSLYLIYCIENGVYEYSAMKVIGVPKDKRELKQLQFQSFDYDNAVQYYKELVTDMYREICLIEKLNDTSQLISYMEHMIFQRSNGVGYDIFLRMEHLPNLTEGLRFSNMGIQDILRLGKDICDALVICENYNIVHGELRPETIFITESGSYKLGDFSFSRCARIEEITYKPMDMGDYMAPEVYQGESYDIRADIYSLGLVLYQLFNNNKLPFFEVHVSEATIAERQLAIQQRFECSELPNPSHATEELAKVIGKACNNNPKIRYQSAEEFKDALTAIAVFLEADFLFSDMKDSFTPEDVYIKNEVVATIIIPEPIAEELHTMKEVTSSQENNLIPQEDASTFQEKNSIPQEVVTTSQENKSISQEDVTTSQENNSIFQEDVTTSQEKVLLPQEAMLLAQRELEVLALAGCAYSKNVKPRELMKANLERERKMKRKQELVKEDSGKSMRPWVFSFVALVIIASFFVLLTQIDYTKQVESGFVEASSTNPTPMITQLPSSVVEPSKEPIDEPTEQPTPEPIVEPTIQPTIIPDLDPTKIDKSTLLTIVDTGKSLTSLETITDLDKAIALDLSNNQLSELDGLKNAVYLETLVLSHNKIVNVDPLHTLTSLKVLDISNNKVTSFIKLRNLEQLEILSASNNLITSLEGLEKMTALKILYLNGNSIQDISVLKELTSLEMIDLSNNKIKEKDMKALKKTLPDCIIIY